jgi:hypothetical protein
MKYRVEAVTRTSVYTTCEVEADSTLAAHELVADYLNCGFGEELVAVLGSSDTENEVAEVISVQEVDA